MPIYNVKCKNCGDEEEVITLRISEKISKCKCGGIRRILAPSGKSPSFKLIFDNKKDTCDWDGNRSQYYDEYKKQKSEGKNVRINELDHGVGYR